MSTPLTQKQLADLRDAAYAGRCKGWRPYSKFAVGAAVMTIDGKYYGGAGNVECANYTLTKHAEETALCEAIAMGAISRCGLAFLRAVYLATTDGHRVTPCGGCRQFLWEFSDEHTLVINELPNGRNEIRTLAKLMPLP